jgi:hypothetical protein
MIGTDPLFGDLRESKFYGTEQWQIVVNDARLEAEAVVAWLYCVTKAGGFKRQVDITPEEVEAAVGRNAELVQAIREGRTRNKPR